MSLGATLKNLRLRKGESLQDLANAVGASKAHIWELEIGKSKNPSLDLLKKLAEHFEISLSLLTGEILDEEDMIVLHRDVKGLSDADREFLRKIIQGMKERAQKEKKGDET